MILRGIDPTDRYSQYTTRPNVNTFGNNNVNTQYHNVEKPQETNPAFSVWGNILPENTKAENIDSFENIKAENISANTDSSIWGKDTTSKQPAVDSEKVKFGELTTSARTNAVQGIDQSIFKNPANITEAMGKYDKSIDHPEVRDAKHGKLIYELG